jgi:hypothetical protein
LDNTNKTNIWTKQTKQMFGKNKQNKWLDNTNKTNDLTAQTKQNQEWDKSKF